MSPRTIARLVAAGRLGFGIALVATPGLIAPRWIGREGDGPGAHTLATGLGARDLVLAAGVLNALERGGARPWLIGSALADLGDLAATLRARRELPAASVAALIALAGGASLVGAWLAAQDDW
jgi:hypothetical protein